MSQGSFLLLAEGTWEMSWMSSSVQQLSVSSKERKTFQQAVSWAILFDIFITSCHYTIEYTVLQVFKHAVTHCLRTAHSPSGVTPGWVWPCACRPEDTSPPSGFHQSAQPPNMHKPIAERER